MATTKPKRNSEQEAEDQADARSLAAIRRMSKEDKKLIPGWKVAENLGYHDIAKKLRQHSR